MRTAIIIPARFDSSRLPGKPLIKINGKELILRVIEKCEKILSKKDIFVATDSKKIFDFVQNKKYNCIMTNKYNLTGTDRVAEVAMKIKYDIYINVQGDEPLIEPECIKKIISSKKKNFNKVICGYAAFSKFDKKNNLNIPKVVFNSKNELIYISRSAIPGSKNNKFNSFHKQVCIYAFNKSELKLFTKFKKKPYLESVEDIEILRFFELNKKIKMVKTEATSYAVDVFEDIKKVEKILKKRKWN